MYFVSILRASRFLPRSRAAGGQFHFRVTIHRDVTMIAISVVTVITVIAVIYRVVFMIDHREPNSLIYCTSVYQTYTL